MAAVLGFGGWEQEELPPLLHAPAQFAKGEGATIEHFPGCSRLPCPSKDGVFSKTYQGALLQMGWQNMYASTCPHISTMNISHRPLDSAQFDCTSDSVLVWKQWEEGAKRSVWRSQIVHVPHKLSV